LQNQELEKGNGGLSMPQINLLEELQQKLPILFGVRTAQITHLMLTQVTLLLLLMHKK
jgi:hypothetical protein